MSDLKSLLENDNIGLTQLDSLVRDLNESIYALKDEIDSTISTQLQLFPVVFTHTEQLHKEISDLNSRADSACNKVVPNAQNEFNALSLRYETHHSELNNATAVLTALNHIKSLHDWSRRLQQSSNENNLEAAVEHYRHMTSLMQELLSNNVTETKTVKNISKDMRTQRKLILSQIDGKIAKSFIYSDTGIEIVKLSCIKFAPFSLLSQMGVLEDYIQSWSRQVYERIYLPCLKEAKFTLKLSRDSVFLSYTEIPQNDLNGKLTNFSQVLDALRSTFLGEKLGNTSVFKVINHELGASVVAALELHCLKEHVPLTVEQFDSYDYEIVKKAEISLMELGFVETETCLENFYSNLSAHFISATVSRILSEGREIIRQPLHETVKVECEPIDRITEESTNLPSLLPQPCLNSRLLQLPPIAISESTQRFVTLVCDTVREAHKLKLECACDLYRCARNLVSMYCDLTVLYHTTSTNQLPFLAAVQYNNLMYMAHHCHIIGLMSVQYPASFLTKNLHLAALTFLDFVPTLRNSANCLLQGCVSKQIWQLVETLNESNSRSAGTAASSLIGGGDSGACNDFVQYSACVKRCFHQIRQLAKTWQPVLPPVKFTAVVSQLLTLMADKVPDFIVRLEDITGSDLSILEKLLLSMENETKDISNVFLPYSSDMALTRLIPTFHKIPSIRTVFSLSLTEIEDKWSQSLEGSGEPFLEASELRALIRALFQNTDLRAKVLAKIL